MATVNELVTKFSFQGSAQPLDQYNQYLSSSIGMLGGLAAAFGTATAALRSFTSSVLQGLDPLIDLTMHTQTNIQNMRELGFIAGQTGSDADTLQSSIQALNDQIGQAAIEGSEDFARLGISVRDANGEVRNAGDVFMELRERVQQMDLSLQETQTLAESIGIDQSLVKMLRLSREEFQGMSERARQFGQINRENAETAHEYTNALREMRFGFDTLKTLMATALAPAMQRLSDTLSNLLVEHKDLIVNGVQWLAEWIGNIMSTLRRLAPVIGTIIGLFAAWKIATMGLGSVLAVVFSPITLITGAIIALLAIVDDLIVAFRGGNSVIASFFQEFFGIDIQPILQDIVDEVKRMVSVLGDMFGNLVNILTDTGKFIFNILTGNFGDAWDNIKSIGNEMNDFFANFFEFLFGGFNLEPLYTMFRDWWNWLQEFISPVGDLLSNISGFLGFGGMEQSNQNIPGQKMQPGDNTRGTQTIDNRRIEQKNEIIVQTPDAQGAARSVDNRLQRQLKDADQHLRGGRK